MEITMHIADNEDDRDIIVHNVNTRAW